MEGKGVQTLDRALDIIELLSPQREGLGVTEIAKRLTLHKSTVHRLLNALADRGYIERDRHRGSYRLGLKFVEIGSLRLNQIELKTEAMPYLRRLAENFGQAAHLAILSGTDAVYIEKIEPNSGIRMYSQIGRRIPAHSSALGKSLLSDMDEEALKATVDAMDFERFTPNTIVDPAVLLESVAQVRQRGWANDNEEHEIGIRCVASPIFDYTGRVIAAVSVSGDKRRISAERDEETADRVMAVAEEISRRLGYVPKAGSASEGTVTDRSQ